MTENLQKNEQQGPFSPLQSGCAFVMLTNMMIYLAVVVFVFNLLDPSKIDASYIAKRGFTAQPAAERDEDKAFRQTSEQRRKDQQEIQAGIVDSARDGSKQEISPAAKLSEIKTVEVTAGRLDEPEKPVAGLSRNALRSGSIATRTAQRSLRTGRTSTRTSQTRVYSVSMYPQATLPQAYSPVHLPTPQILLPEKYETLPVELASGIDFPMFGLPRADNLEAYLYSPAKPVPDPVRGERKISSPPAGAESLYTNVIKKAKEPLPSKPL